MIGLVFCRNPDQRYGDLLDDFNIEALKGGNPAGMIGEQADTAEVQVGENLRSNTNFALRPAFAFR